MKKGLTVFLAVLVFIVMLSGGLYVRYFVSMSALPEGELIGEYASSFSDCSVRLYRCPAGATVDNSVRGRLSLKTAKRKPSIGRITKAKRMCSGLMGKR